VRRTSEAHAHDARSLRTRDGGPRSSVVSGNFVVEDRLDDAIAGVVVVLLAMARGHRERERRRTASRAVMRARNSVGVMSHIHTSWRGNAVRAGPAKDRTPNIQYPRRLEARQAWPLDAGNGQDRSRPRPARNSASGRSQRVSTRKPRWARAEGIVPAKTVLEWALPKPALSGAVHTSAGRRL
jgi:hypothetical protein